MTLQRRTFIAAAGALAGAAAFPTQASDYPTRPIRIVVPFPAASLTDNLVRAVTHRITDLGQPFVIESKPGGNTFLGMSLVAAAPPDGYTLAASTISTDVVNPMVYKKMPYDPNALTPLAVLGYSPYVLIVPSALKINTVQELIALVRSRPGELNFGSAGTGNSTHIVSEKFLQDTKLKMLHIPYPGSSPAHQALMRGDLNFYSDVLTSALPHIQSGRFKALAVTSESRHPSLPDVPTMIESGYKDFVMTAWYGLQIPRNTPQAAIDRLASSLDKALVDPTLVAEFGNRGMVISPPGGPRHMAAVIARDRELWGSVIKTLNIQLD